MFKRMETDEIPKGQTKKQKKSKAEPWATPMLSG